MAPVVCSANCHSSVATRAGTAMVYSFTIGVVTVMLSSTLSRITLKAVPLSRRIVRAAPSDLAIKSVTSVVIFVARRVATSAALWLPMTLCSILSIRVSLASVRWSVHISFAVGAGTVRKSEALVVAANDPAPDGLTAIESIVMAAPPVRVILMTDPLAEAVKPGRRVIAAANPVATASVVVVAPMVNSSVTPA